MANDNTAAPQQPGVPNDVKPAAPNMPAADLGTPAAAPSLKKPASIGELFATLSTQITSLIRGEIELTKAKATAYASRMGMGIGLLGAAGLLGLYLLGWIFHTIELALALVLPAWAASLIVVAILLLIILVLALLGKNAVDKARLTTPDPKSGLEASVEALKKGLRHE
ncbi:phage holin family protein [Schaalia sp. Marseille-Q2122]|uniref:phage holin family protein n=1 Tax=Schaalia sp. Marseille-Q2122 TaxID=2736604 RepID=UPI0020CA921F|nr:phage holin family protein [Schaalia sp. Marseille-Q2122]